MNILYCEKVTCHKKDDVWGIFRTREVNGKCVGLPNITQKAFLYRRSTGSKLGPSQEFLFVEMVSGFNVLL
jgi:hypothetical protein